MDWREDIGRKSQHQRIPHHEAAGRGQEAGNGRGQARRDRARSASSGGEDRLLQRADRAAVCGFRGL